MVYTKAPLWGGFSTPKQGPSRGPCGVSALVPVGGISREEAILEAALVWGPLSDDGVGYSANNEDIYLACLGNSANSGTQKEQLQKEVNAKPCWAWEMGQCRLEILLLDCLSLDSAQYFSRDLYPYPYLPPSPCLPAVLRTYTCCVTFGKCCPLSRSQTSFSLV